MTNLAIANGKIAGSGWSFELAPAICGGEDEYCAVGATAPIALATVVDGTPDSRLVKFYNRSGRDLMRLGSAIIQFNPEAQPSGSGFLK